MNLHGGSGEGPCGLLRRLMDRAADGRAWGLGTLYARAHAALCPGCGRYLRSLAETSHRLAASREEATDADALERLSRSLSE